VTKTSSAKDLPDVRALALAAARAASDKKGERTTVLEVAGVLAITDTFVITSAPNSRLVRTIADEVEEKVKAAGGPGPLRIEGRDDATWVLLDYGDFVVHVFLNDVRDFYDLERLWSDAPRIPFDEDGPPARAAAASGE